MYPPGILAGVVTEEQLENIDLDLQTENTPSTQSQPSSQSTQENDESADDVTLPTDDDESTAMETDNFADQGPSSSAPITCCIICNTGSPSHNCVQVHFNEF